MTRSSATGSFTGASAVATSARQGSATPVAVEEVVGDCGVRAYLMTDSNLPFLSMSMSFAAGGVFDPLELVGLAAMTASLFDEGAGELGSQEFHARLEDNAIRLSFDADRDALTASLKALNVARDEAFELLRLALTAPRFDPEPVERVRNQMLADLRRRETNPGYVASRTWFERAFVGHAYALPPNGTAEGLAAIDRVALQDFCRRGVARGNLSIGVSGDIGPAELKVLLDQTFAALPDAAALPIVTPAVPDAADTIVVPMSLPQSVVTFGHAGIGRHDPDFYGAYVANYILGGGGFSSRLMQEVREARGLAYSVGTQLFDAEYSPLWLGGVATKNEQVTQSISIIKEQVHRLRDGDVTADDLANAKTYLTGSFALRLTSNDSVARMLVGMMSKRLGADYLTARNRHIEAVDLDGLRRAAGRLLAGEMLVTVVGAPIGLDG